MSVLLGLSAHPLLVHLTVVAIPLAALLAMVVARFPRVPALIKLTTLVLGALSVALVPVMESSGKALEEKVPDSAAVERHAQLGETLLPWVIGLLIAIVVVLAADRWLRPARPGGSATSGAGSRLASRVVTVSVAVAAIAVAGGALVQTVRIGHSGAQATWSSPGAATPGSTQVDRGEHGERSALRPRRALSISTRISHVLGEH